MSKYISSNKRCLSPILSGRISKKVKETCIKCKRNVSTSPDLSQAAKRKMTAKIHSSRLDSKKPVTPGVKLQLGKCETYDVNLKNPVVKKVYVPCGICETEVLSELQLNKIMHVKSVNDSRLINSFKFDDPKESPSTGKNEWPTLNTNSCLDNLPDKEEICCESDNCNSTSPDLSLRKHRYMKVNKMRSNGKLIRKNLFGCVPEKILNEFCDIHNNLPNLFDKTGGRLVPPKSSVFSRLISENLDGLSFDESLLHSSEKKIETKSKMIATGKHRKAKGIFHKNHGKIISKKNRSFQHRDILKENENSRRYGILPVTLKKSSETKTTDNSLKYICNDSNEPLVCGENITGNGSELLPIISSSSYRNSEDGTPRKSHYYFDSDEESYTISEVSSPIKKDEINSCKKPISQLKCLANVKAWSFKTDHFETTFSKSDHHKKSDIEFINNSDDLSCKKQILIPLSEKYKELSEMLKKGNEDEFVISEVSSESSPEEKKNSSKICMIKKRTKELKLKQSKNKNYSNYSTPILELEIHSQKPNNFQNCKVTKKCGERANPEKSFEHNVGGNNKKHLIADVVNSISTDRNQLDQGPDYHCSPGESQNFRNDEKNTNNNIELHKDYILHEDDSFSKSQVSELIIETVSSQSNTGNNATDLEIDFSDVSSLPIEPQTPPSKLRLKNRKNVNIDSSSKKTKIKYPDDSLIGRLRTARHRYNSNASVLQHMLNKKEAKFSTANLPVFYVKRILETYSQTVIACRPFNYSESTDVEKHESCNNLRVSNELLILTDPSVFTSINVIPGSCIKIHPPWKVFDDPESNFQMVLGPSCIEILKKGFNLQCVQNTGETCCVVCTEFKCICHQDFVQNSGCNYAFSDELFTEVFCPPPSKISDSSQFVKRTIPMMYDYEDHYSGTIGHARAFNLLNSNVDIFFSIVTVIKEKVAFLEHGKLCVIVKDIVNEISILILMLQCDVDKWNMWTNNSCKTESHFRITGIKFTHRIPLQSCREIFDHLPAEKFLQSVIFCLSPVSNFWNVTEKI